MKYYEYKTLQPSANAATFKGGYSAVITDEQLSRLGAEGWEVVHVYDRTTMLLKRARSSGNSNH